MESIVPIILPLICLAVIAVIIADHARGRVELLSLRNLALAGFLIFQVVSSAKGFQYFPEHSYNLTRPEATVTKWLSWCVLFLLVFFPSYRAGFGAPRLSKLMPQRTAATSVTFLWGMVISLTIIAAATRFSVRLPYVSTLAGWTSIALCSVSAGLAGWIWAPRLFNPVVAIPAVAFIVINLAIAQYGSFGRRPMASVGLGMIWGMYFGHFRYLSLPSMTFRLAAVSVPPLIAFSLFSSVRSWDLIDDPRALLRAVFERGDVSKSVTELGSQDTAIIGMWVMETAVENPNLVETRPLFTIGYFFQYPIPRALFDVVGFEKSYPLSTMTADLSGREGVKLGYDGVTNPAGVIGNASAEGGLYALVIYAMVGAFMLRFLDEIGRNNYRNPFLVMPVGSALGQCLGLARGENAVFAFTMVYSTLSAVFIMAVISRILAKQLPMEEEPEEHYDWYTPEYIQDGNQHPGGGYDDGYGEELEQAAEPRALPGH